MAWHQTLNSHGPPVATPTRRIRLQHQHHAINVNTLPLVGRRELSCDSQTACDQRLSVLDDGDSWDLAPWNQSRRFVNFGKHTQHTSIQTKQLDDIISLRTQYLVCEDSQDTDRMQNNCTGNLSDQSRHERNNRPSTTAHTRNEANGEDLDVCWQ